MAKEDKPGTANKPQSFREKLGAEDIDINDYKVDDLRKIASEYDISGSHDMKKVDLVAAINTARKNESAAGAD